MSEQWTLILAGVIISLQGWILAEIIRLKVSSAASAAGYDRQLSRIVSDIESEKGTRKRLHADFEARLRSVELIIYSNNLGLKK